MRGGLVTIFLCGDVMLGRGVDQILPHPGDPTLREAYVLDARDYVELAEAVNGPIPRPVDFSWPWGDALPVLDAEVPDARVVNLETSITRSDEFAPGKAVHYRMNPANLPCLRAALPDACVLANNHVMDFGRWGLEETLDVLAEARLPAGAPDPTALRRGGLWSFQQMVTGAYWLSRWGWNPAVLRQAGPPQRIGPVSPSYRNSRPRPPPRSSTECSI